MTQRAVGAASFLLLLVACDSGGAATGDAAISDAAGDAASSDGASDGAALSDGATGELAPGDIFTADYSSDLGNWDVEIGLGTERVQGRVPGGGPGGLDAFEIARVPNPGEHYSGHNVLLPNFAEGTSRFYRWFEWHDPANNYDNPDGVLRHKRLLIGNGQSAGQRMILNVNADALGEARPWIEAIFDSSPVASTDPFALDTWVAIQVEVRYGAAAYVKVWLDSDDYDLPTAVVSGGTYTQTDTGFTSFGMYSNNALPTGGVHTWRDAAFRVATTFDAGWSAWLSANR